VLEDMNRDNGYAGPDAVDCEPVSAGGQEEDGGEVSFSERVGGQIRIVFGSTMLGSTLIVTYTIFVLNMAYYGSVYGLPFVLTDVMQTDSAANELLIGVLWEFVGFLFAFVFGMSMTRKRAMRWYLCLCAISFLAFVLGAHAPQQATDAAHYGSIARWTAKSSIDANALIAKIGYYGTKVGLAVGFLICYQYSVEIYPTSARMTGCAITLAGGRVAAMLAPMVYEGMVGLTNSFLSFFFIVVAFMLVNIVLIDWLPFETAGKGLADTLEDLVADFTTPEHSARSPPGSPERRSPERRL